MFKHLSGRIIFILFEDTDINVKDPRRLSSKELDLKQKLLDVESKVRFSEDPDVIKVDNSKQVSSEQKKRRSGTAKHKKKPVADVRSQSLTFKKRKHLSQNTLFLLVYYPFRPISPWVR